MLKVRTKTSIFKLFGIILLLFTNNFFVYYVQSVVHGTWLGMDFGTDAANVEHWNSTKPPVYFYEPVSETRQGCQS